MITKQQYGKLAWVDLENPTIDEVRSVSEEYNLSHLVANEIAAPSARQKVDLYSDYVYIILHFPNAEGRGNQEVDFVIGKDFIITTHYEVVDNLHDFSKVFEINSILDKSKIGTHAGFVFYYMIRSLYQTLLQRVEAVDGLLSDAENQIFEGNERAMVIELSKINRMLLSFKSSTRLHKDILESFESAGKQLFGDTFTHYLRSITGEYFKVQSALQNNKEYLDELRVTNDSLLGTKQNETITKLTIITFLTFPLTLIVGLFGMNVTHTPLVGSVYDFWIIVGILLVTLAAMFIYFRSKRWL